MAIGPQTPATPESTALNRIADALFTQAKIQKRQAAVSEKMLAMQEANLAVTRQLESALTHKAETTGGWVGEKETSNG